MQPFCVSSRIFWLGFVSALSLFGCASVPAVDDMGIEQQAGTPQIVGAQGPLTAARSRAILTRLEAQSQGSDLLERHLAIEQAVAGTPLVAGNHTTLLHDGPETFRAMFKAV